MAQPSEQIHSLQILRGVAAASVAYLHTFTSPRFGNFGVDLFFVISGFVMAMIVSHRNVTPVDFILTRLARIVPLYWVVTTGVLLTAWIAPKLMGTTSANLANYFMSLLFVPHFRENGSLFPMLMPGWSLNYEMIFYATIFVVIACNRDLFAYLVSGLLVAYSVIGLLAPQGWVVNEFFATALWFEFILGIVCFSIYKRSYPSSMPKVVVILTLVALFGILIVGEGQGYRLLFAGIPSFFILVLALQLEDQIRCLPTHFLRILINIGDASYATYLSHLFIIGFIERVVLIRLGIEKTPLTAIFTVGCCLVAGSLIYHYLDKPITARARRLAKRLAVQAPSSRLSSAESVPEK